MFEFAVAFKYLIPRRRHLSVALIAIMSIVVVSLVVWLLLVFLSVTEGMEKSWLTKLTDVNGPIRITPTEKYYSSYYYQIDSISSASDFTYKTLGEKRVSQFDPHNIEEDPEIPSFWPDDRSDLVFSLETILKNLQEKEPISYQDFEMSGATLKLQMLRGSPGLETMQSLTQVSYLATPPTPKLSSLLKSPTVDDVNHLLFLSKYRLEDETTDSSPTLEQSNHTQETIYKILDWISPKLVTIHSLQGTLLPEGVPFYLSKQNKTITRYANYVEVNSSGVISKAPLQSLFHLDPPFIANVVSTSPFLEIEGLFQKKTIKGAVSWRQVKVHSFEKIKDNHLDDHGIFVPKNFEQLGARIGDRGFLSYYATTPNGMQEQRLLVEIKGFYDPGVFSIGYKCLLVPRAITRAINSSTSSTILNQIPANGFQVWIDPEKASLLKSQILQALKEKGEDSYWNVTSYEEYDFAQELLQQFRSDRLLFSLVGVIILIVACSNIVSFLIILVNDKQKEIAIFRSMGASTFSIATIFGICGLCIGLLGFLIGYGAAFYSLTHINSIASMLSSLQGQEAFLPTFYGDCLPNLLSGNSALFLFIATPIVALLAGIIPATKACLLSPSDLLRAQS